MIRINNKGLLIVLFLGALTVILLYSPVGNPALYAPQSQLNEYQGMCFEGGIPNAPATHYFDPSGVSEMYLPQVEVGMSTGLMHNASVAGSVFRQKGSYSQQHSTTRTPNPNAALSVGSVGVFGSVVGALNSSRISVSAGNVARSTNTSWSALSGLRRDSFANRLTASTSPPLGSTSLADGLDLPMDEEGHFGPQRASLDGGFPPPGVAILSKSTAT